MSRPYPSESWARTRSLTLDDDGVLWLRLYQVDDEDTFEELGPVETIPDVPPGLRKEFAKLLDLWQDAGRDDPAEEQRRDYLLAVSG